MWALKIPSSEDWVFEQGRKKSRTQKEIKIQAAGQAMRTREKHGGAGTSVPTSWFMMGSGM